MFTLRSCLQSSAATTVLFRLILLLCLDSAASAERSQNADRRSDPPVVLFWNAPRWFLLKKTANDPRCTFTSDRGTLPNAAAVVFYGDDDVTADYPSPALRPVGQQWVFAEWEPPSNYHQQSIFKRWPRELALAVNSTLTYRADSDIVAPYGWVVPRESGTVKIPPPSSRPRLAVWVTSHCRTTSKREEYVFELQKHLDGSLDIFGNCGQPIACKQWTDSCAITLYEPYKFVLAFENTRCVDYITEKFWYNGLAMGPVPVVLGASRKDVERVAPAGSFLHVDDFSSPAALASYMQDLARDPIAYAKFHAWRGSASSVETQMQTKAWSNLCSHVVATGAAHKRQLEKRGDVISWWQLSPHMVQDERGKSKSSACEESSILTEVLPWATIASFAALSGCMLRWSATRQFQQAPLPSTPLFGAVQAPHSDVVFRLCLRVCAGVATTWSLRVVPMPITVGTVLALPSVIFGTSSSHRQSGIPAAALAPCCVVATSYLLRWTSPTAVAALLSVAELSCAHGKQHRLLAALACLFALFAAWTGGAVAAPQSARALYAVSVWISVQVFAAKAGRVLGPSSSGVGEPQTSTKNCPKVDTWRTTHMSLLLAVASLVISAIFGAEALWTHTMGFAPWYIGLWAAGIAGSVHVLMAVAGVVVASVCSWLATDPKTPGMDGAAWACTATTLTAFGQPAVGLLLAASSTLNGMRLTIPCARTA